MKTQFIVYTNNADAMAFNSLKEAEKAYMKLATEVIKNSLVWVKDEVPSWRYL